MMAEEQVGVGPVIQAFIRTMVQSTRTTGENLHVSGISTPAEVDTALTTAFNATANPPDTDIAYMLQLASVVEVLRKLGARC
jgi:hypothetical protein